MEIVATIIIAAIILRLTWGIIGDVRRSDWNALTVHSIQITCCGLILALLAAFGDS